tara:strand:- start:23891 stop:26425 length:2535 start_codon:yes stop_codon:yes gene_type:complete
MRIKNIFAYLITPLIILLFFGCNNSHEIDFDNDFNFDWKFSLLDSQEVAYQNDYNDSNWRCLKLPHDWSIELPFDSVNGDGATGYLLGGVGWYRKYFNLSFDENEVVSILFDGVYNHAEIWINEKRVGGHKYGYSPFQFNITSYLNKNGKDNVISIKVDHSRYVDSRWYTGSGIYRNIKITKNKKLHIPAWGTFITTPDISNSLAKINLEIEIDNQFNSIKTIDVITRIYDQENNVVLELENRSQKFNPQKQFILQNGFINNPKLWSPENPNLYKAITSLYQEKKLIQKFPSIFGIRKFRFDNNLGFFLNGENIKIKGVNIHHDGGLVGASVPKNVWKRRLKKLKKMGANAIRSAHNPASEEFLELCDELGFLVQEEFFDEWDYPKDKRLNVWERHDDYLSRGLADYFSEIAESDLKNTVKSHRNHPSIFQWSIGNEIEWTYPNVKASTGYYDGDKRIAPRRWAEPPNSPKQIHESYKKFISSKYNIEFTAQKLSNWTRELDTTRFITANCIIPSASFETGYTDALDVVGFSYRQIIYDYAHRNYPNKPIQGAENWGQWHEWKAVLDRPFVGGVFIWTGIDYLGESFNKWPKKGSGSGVLDLAGFEKPRFHMFKSLWNNQPHLFICTQKLKDSEYIVDSTGHLNYKLKDAWKFKTWSWQEVNEHWNYENNEEIVVEVISNLDTVELFLNDTSFGVFKLSDFPDKIYKWLLPFRPGKIVAKSYKIKAEIQTAKEPISIKLLADKVQMTADGYDVVHIVAQLLDENENFVLNSEEKIKFSVQGDINILGVDNGSNRNPGPYKSNTVITKNGRALLIIQSKKQSNGIVNITASSDKLKSNIIELRVK